jgi:hypothetical protein
MQQQLPYAIPTWFAKSRMSLIQGILLRYIFRKPWALCAYCLYFTSLVKYDNSVEHKYQFVLLNRNADISDFVPIGTSDLGGLFFCQYSDPPGLSR